MTNPPFPSALVERASMVEKVKAALFDALEQHLQGADGLALQGGRFFISGEDCHIDADALARAVIESMREPTEAMVAAGIAQTHECTDDWTASAACIPEHVWPKMIDSALSEGEKG